MPVADGDFHRLEDMSLAVARPLEAAALTPRSRTRSPRPLTTFVPDTFNGRGIDDDRGSSCASAASFPRAIPAPGPVSNVNWARSHAAIPNATTVHFMERFLTGRAAVGWDDPPFRIPHSGFRNPTPASLGPPILPSAKSQQGWAIAHERHFLSIRIRESASRQHFFGHRLPTLRACPVRRGASSWRRPSETRGRRLVTEPGMA